MGGYFLPIFSIVGRFFPQNLSEGGEGFVVKHVTANDSEDLVNFIIMTLHEELTKANKNKQINTSTTAIFGQKNAQTVFNNYAQNLMLENKSIIGDLFYSMNCNITLCGGCGIKTFKYQT